MPELATDGRSPSFEYCANKQQATEATSENCWIFLGLKTNYPTNKQQDCGDQKPNLLKSNYEFTGRYSTINYYEVTNVSDINQYTIGISKYVVGHKLKVQTDFTYSERDSEQDFLLWRLGFDLHF